MSTDSGEPTPAAPDRREAVREKAQLVRARQSRARLARRIGLSALAAGAVAAIVAVVAWSVMSTMGGRDLSPENITADGFAIDSVAGATSDQAVITDPSPTPEGETKPTPTPDPSATTAAPVDIRVYVDYLSPGAREWHLANVQQLSTWVDEGAATLTYHPVSMLTAKSNGTKYSLRAAAASACVASHAEDVYFAYNSELLSRQPAIDSDGFSDAELADIAQAIGAADPDEVRSCIEDGDFIEWAKDATERAIEGIPDTDGLTLTGTPMILVNGQPYMGVLTDAAEFSQFVLTSASDRFYKEQAELATPTPTPSATP
ncbi:MULTISPECIES: DsbA family protein [unclassified Microbacterium]|uniref:DsbA family protein n=1 Tax=unclassified Microbacterium TaxID=2609290 RepID=UPI00386D6430